jgi:hypothetical protein
LYPLACIVIVVLVADGVKFTAIFGHDSYAYEVNKVAAFAKQGLVKALNKFGVNKVFHDSTFCIYLAFVV